MPDQSEHHEVTAGANGGRSRFRTAVVIGVLGLAVVWLAASFSQPTALPAAWGESLESGMIEARDQGKPVLVLATADWCGPCQSLRRNVLSQDDVAARLQRDFVLVKLDLTASNSPARPDAARLNVGPIPTLIALNPESGAELGRQVGNVPQDRFNVWLDGLATRTK